MRHLEPSRSSTPTRRALCALAAALALHACAVTPEDGAGDDTTASELGGATCAPVAPSVPGMRVVAALQGWWGQSGHWSGVRYNSADPAVVAQQQARAERVGIHGFSVNWYGEGSQTDRTLRAQLAEAARHRDFKVFAMYDGGALNPVLATPGHTDQDFTDLAIRHFRYIMSQYAADPNYLRYNGRPLIQVFRKADTTPHVDWHAVVAAIGGPGAIELQADTPNVVAPFTGGFAWVGPDSVDSHGIWQGEGTRRLDSFYAAIATHPGASVMGAAWNWFNDARASWGTNCRRADGTTVRCRVIPPNGGRTWCDTWAHNLSHHPPVVQVATWDDYEEGSAIESGIDFNGTLPPAWVPGSDPPPPPPPPPPPAGATSCGPAQSVAYSTLATYHPSCDGTTGSDGLACNAAISRYCGSQDCATTGFGPAERVSGSAQVLCVHTDALRSVSYTTTLRARHPSCDGTTERWGPECAAAIHRYCAASGFASGFGPIENSGDQATVACLPASGVTVLSTTYAALAARHPGCDGVSETWGPSCNAAVQRLCVAMGAVGGYGPVEHAGGQATVVCVNR